MSAVQVRIFPARLSWSDSGNDVLAIPRDTKRLRLVNKATGFERLREFESLEALWCFGIDQTKLEQISACSSLKELYCEYYLRISDISCLKRLPHLEILRLDSCFNIKSFDQLGEFTHLSGLSLENFKNVHDIKPLAKLTNLRQLAVEGSIWTRMKIDSLAPLSNLEDLEYLGLSSLKVVDESLAPLANLKKLKKLFVANYYPLAEFARLAAKLPNTECTWFAPYMSTNLTCKKCNEEKRVILTGKGTSALCPRCDARRLQKHVVEFEQIKSSAR
jgi:hypothetical protein